jgi:D-alanine-D-alanine ligase
MQITHTPSKVKVALLAGGNSGERKISLASGDGAQQALIEAGYHVDRFDPASRDDLMNLISGTYDIAFLCMHGKGGEDGVLQGFLETIHLPYTGPGVWASATAMNKAHSKVFYDLAGIPTAPYVYIEKGTEVDIPEITSLMQGECVVKPATEGSALGIYIVEGEEAIEHAINKVHEIDNLVVVEKYIKGTELTVAVLGNDEPFALPVIEIVPRGEFYDFDSKYAPGGSQHICPARLNDEVTRIVQEEAINAHKALNCSGVSRSDFILDTEGTPWILETNTLPGMTTTSLLPDAGRAAGISFPELCSLLIEYGFEKAQD